MPVFRYKTRGADGTVEENTITAQDRFAVYRLVRKEGRTIVSVAKESKGGIKKFFNMDNINRIIGSVKTQEKILFAKNLSSMLNAGLSLSRAIAIMERQSKNQKFKHILKEIIKSIEGGHEFNSALGKHPKIFSPLFISMVRAGEESGKLSDSLLVVATQMNNSHTLKKKLRGALIYPSIIVVVLIAVGALMLIFIVPTLSDTFKEMGAELPTSTKAIIALSDFLTNRFILAFGIVLGIIVGFIASLRTSKGRRVFEYAILHVPIISTIVKEINSARTARTLASLLSSGVGMVKAVKITNEVIQNSYYQDILKEIEEHIQKGGKISETISEYEHLYPIMMGEMISVGEETGNLSTMLADIATYYEDEVSQKTKNMSTIVEPFLMIIVGIGVGFFAISMITPIYSISTSM